MIITKTPPSGSENLIKEISGRCGVSTAFAKLLVTRGIKSVEEAEKFIRPDKKYLHDPYLFGGMKAATERIKAAKENGLCLLTLEVRKSNMPARCLYEGFGFEALGERKDYYKKPTENAVIMTLMLGEN